MRFEQRAGKGGDGLSGNRPRYADWLFPKGKLDPGEHVVTAAVREVAEETGLDVRLGPALGRQRYRMSNGRWKRVDYWTAKVLGSDDVGDYRPNEEIDAGEWVGWEAATTRPTYPHDRDTPRAALAHGRPLPEVRAGGKARLGRKVRCFGPLAKP